MKMKKWFSLVTLGLALILLAACGQKSAEDIIKTELKDSYVGYSEVSGYDGLMFIGGGDELTFDKKENSITNSNGEKIYFSLISEDDIPPATKGVITKLESQLEGTDNFTIITSSKKNPKIEDSEGGYQIALSNGGKNIRIIELYQDYASDGSYYDFSGKAE
ncbi:TPA: hypothetical protein TVL14_000024 [Streptococcus equi subsp. zooepidemicus]|nr:hypothetical protein [Streptococcus equi subsp. zooepidemicus]HEL1185611.1 hypothetical protein [Streptococcus equi subsp. zooepidemicus]HEL1297763.1 hypothetical protein [Streptococcus equi subsp. zooepidemicus]